MPRIFFFFFWQKSCSVSDLSSTAKQLPCLVADIELKHQQGGKRHVTKNCRRYAGPLKSSHFVFALEKFQEIQLLTRNLSKSLTQQHLAEHLKTTASPMSFFLCFSWKDRENSLFSRARQIISTTRRKKNPHHRVVR